MEIYTNSKAADRAVFLEFPDMADTVDVELWKDGEKLYTFMTVAATPGEGYTVTLPLRFIQFDADLQVHWELTYTEDGFPHTIKRMVPVEVVTPILSAREIREIDPVVFSNAVEVRRIEKAVRHVIQAYTGQEFGYFDGTEKVRGDGSPALYLPRRLVSLSTVNGAAVGSQFAVDPDGYILRHYPWGVPPVKADYFGLHMHVGGVIHNPNNVSLKNWKRETYAVSGFWGWEAVPEAVKEAARLLVNDYACADSQYRDRYLTSMTAADWRIQFHSGAFVRTGNVRADQLLSDYVVTRGWGVI